MNKKFIWLSRVLVVVGGLAMVVGAVDPLEGSLVILPGSALVTLGVFFNKYQPRLFRYWVFLFIMIAVGVGGLFALSSVGGFGPGAYSYWWMLTELPYPVGVLLGYANLAVTLIKFIGKRVKPQTA